MKRDDGLKRQRQTLKMETFLKNLHIIFQYSVKFWNFQLFVVDKSPITIGTLGTGILLLIVGYRLSKKISRQIRESILARVDIDESLRITLEKISFYVLFILLTLFILSFLNIPIAAFTVFGGALAIGVGFGSQNIVNNFISGIILMVERPIRVGDVVEVDGLYGVIEDIGPRSTKVKSAANTHIVVPNSSFLEKNVLNWTLSDDVVRGYVRIGVAYGSDVKKVEELLIESVKSQPAVLNYPQVGVIFEDFGDNALMFEVYYYSKISNYFQLRRLASQIRFVIDGLFRVHGISIAYPQRDIHIDTIKPVQVEIVRER